MIFDTDDFINRPLNGQCKHRIPLGTVCLFCENEYAQKKEKDFTSKVTGHEPDPKPGEKIVINLVVKDLTERAIVGKEKYGTFLMTKNGRDALMDAYQEALDLVMYLRQAIEERNDK